MKLLLPALLLASCSLTPDYVEVSPGFGDSRFDNSPLRGFETHSVFVTVGWNPLARAHRAEAEERWTVTQTYQETMQQLAVARLAQDSGVSSKAVQDALSAHDEAHGDEKTETDMGSSFKKAITEKPKNFEEAVVWLLWFGGLVVSLMLLHLSGALAAAIGFFRGKQNGKAE